MNKRFTFAVCDSSIGRRTFSLTQSRLMEVLIYESDTGKFIWRASGGLAGTYNGEGYRIISVDGVRHQAARLAWLYMTGKHPSYLMDHINRIKDDDRFCNLREATRAQNTINSKLRSDNALGIKHIYWEPKKKLFRVMFTVGGVRRGYGRFKSLDAAKQRANEVRAQIDNVFYGNN